MNVLRFWFAPVLLLVGGAWLAAVVDSNDSIDAPIKFYQYQNGAAAGGYDVVVYVEEARAQKGERTIEARYAGQLWLFASAENRDKFLQTPRRYIPQYGGHCAFGVAQGYLVRGDPLAWTVRDGKLYLNYNKSVRGNWLAGAEGFIVRSEKNWPELTKPESASQ